MDNFLSKSIAVLLKYKDFKMIFILSIFLNLNLVREISEAFNAIWPADKTINQRNENKKC